MQHANAFGRPPICDLDEGHLKLVLEDLRMRFSGAEFGAKMALTAILSWLEWRFKHPMHSHPFLDDSGCHEYCDLFARVQWRCISEHSARDIMCQFDILRSSKAVTREVLSHIKPAISSKNHLADSSTEHADGSPQPAPAASRGLHATAQFCESGLGAASNSINSSDGDHGDPIIVDPGSNGKLLSFVPLI